MEYLTHVVVMGGLAVVLIQQILKLKIVPNQFANKYPIPTLIILSIATAVVEVWQDWVSPNAWTDWVQLVVTIGLIAAFAYNHTLKNWAELRATEG
jgi:fluoride ion exporter CrcB/FEX